MTRLPIVLALVMSPVLSALPQVASEITLPPNGDNQKAEVSQWIGLVKVTISYHSPRVHLRGVTDRTNHIWGELVQYGFFDEGFGPSHATPWRAGANESTTITFSHDVKLEGKDVKAGTYALFLAVAPSGPWTLILSNHVGWGSFQYDSSADALRAPLTPEAAPFTEYLTYAFTDRLPSSAVAFLQWENTRVPFHIAVPNVNDLYIAQIRKDLEAWPGFNYQNWQTAAQFAVANNVALEEALVWANRAIYEPFRNAAAGQQDFSTFSTKAAVLHALGRETDADTTMDRALRSDAATVTAVHQYAMGLLAAGRKERAMTIFQFNRKQHPEDRFLPYVGLARGYTALGDKKRAIENWELALRNVPPAQAANRARFEQALRALKESSQRSD